MKLPTGLAAALTLTAATLPFALAGCDGSPLGPEGDRLEDALDRWRSAGLTSYRYVYEAHCFCGPTATQPVAVVVVDGEVASITSVATGEPVQPGAPGDPAEVLTVEGLFGFLRDALEDEPASFSASYDPGLGYPRSAMVDFDVQVADEEFGFEARELSVLEEPVRARAPR